MLQKEKKIECVEAILNSQAFQKATTSTALLRFLLKSDIEGTYLKEGIIDIDFFGSKESFDKSNTRVRVSIYNLRKKLDDYYEKEGRNAVWKVVIPKGQYGLSFEKVGNGGWLKRIRFVQVLPYLLLITLLVIYMLQKIPDEKPVIWKNFWINEKPTTLFVGDAFGFRGRTVSKGSGWTRDFNINSVEDYYAMLEKNPELKDATSLSNYHYTTFMGVHAAQDFTTLFHNYGSDISIRNASGSSFTDIKAGNMIYVGIIKTQNKFLSIFNDSNPYFNMANNMLIFKNHAVRSDTTINCFTSGTFSDVAIVSRVQGANDTDLFFFLSAHDMGVMATVEYFTNPDSLSAFTKRYLGERTSFTAIYEAHGHERTNMDLETIMVVPF